MAEECEIFFFSTFIPYRIIFSMLLEILVYIDLFIHEYIN